MPFETNLGPFNVDNFSAKIVETENPTEPTTVIRTDQDWEVQAHFETSGGLSHVLTGTWHVGVFLESIGGGQEMEVGWVHLPLTPGPDTIVYETSVKVPGGTITVPNHQTRPFMLVTTVSYMQPDGQPGAMAGYVEAPIVQLYNVT
jgi:hypothetical protein